MALGLAAREGWRTDRGSSIGFSGVASAQGPSCERSVIRAPFSGDGIQGVVTIFGSADVDAFIFYKLEWAPQDNPEVWSAVSSIIEQPVRNGVLDTLDTRSIADGTYRLKLTVVDDRYQERCRFTAEGLVIRNQASPPDSNEGAGSRSGIGPLSNPIETPIPTSIAPSSGSGSAQAPPSESAAAAPTAFEAEASPSEPPDVIATVSPPNATPPPAVTVAADAQLPASTPMIEARSDDLEQAAGAGTESAVIGAGAEGEDELAPEDRAIGGEESSDDSPAVSPTDGERIEDAARAFGIGPAVRAFGMGFAIVLALAGCVWWLSTRRRIGS